MKRLVQNYLYNLGYQFIVLILPFITIPYLTRVLGPENLGIETYTLSIVSIFSAFATSGTTVFATRMVANLRNEQDELNKITYNIFLIRTVMGIIVIIIFYLIAFKLKYTNFLILQMILLLANVLFDFTWYFSGKERFKELTTRNLLVKIVGFLLTIILVKDLGDLDILIIINGLVLLVPNLYFTIIFLREVGKPKRKYFNTGTLLNLVKLLSPFFLLAFVTQVYMNIDKLIIEHFNLTYELGIYSQMIKSFNVFLAPITAIGTILMPFMSNLHYKKSQNEMKDILKLSTNLIFLLSIPIFFGLLLISEEFVKLYFGYNYIDYLGIFRIGLLLIITGSLSNIIIQQVVLPNFQEKIYLQGLVVATIVRLLILILFINFINIYAAILAFLISEILLLSWCIFKTKKIINVIPELFSLNNLKIICSGFIMIIILKILSLGIFGNIILGCLIYPLLLTIFSENLSKKIILNFSKLFNK
jgi:O-antigen/teichoic acid export membrane protein